MKSIKKTILAILLISAIVMTLPLQVNAADGSGDLNKSDFMSTNVPNPGYGFGDEYNSYPWGMEYYQGDLYVGTGRLTGSFQAVAETLFLAGGTMPPLPHIGIVPPAPWKTDWYIPDGYPNPGVIDDAAYEAWLAVSQAEIWRYHGGTWERVYQAPLVDSDLTISPLNPNYPDPPAEGYKWPEATGIRYMQSYTDKNGIPALYAAVGIASFISPGAHAVEPTVILRSYDGATWERVPTPSELGDESRCMTVHNGKLYVGKKGVWCVDEHPTSEGDWLQVFDPTPRPYHYADEVSSLASFNGFLWVGWGMGAPQIWRSNVPDPTNPDPYAFDSEWLLIVDYGGPDQYNMWWGTMKVYKGHLYVGTVTLPMGLLMNGDGGLSQSFDIPEAAVAEIFKNIKGFDLIRIDKFDCWQTVIGPYVPRDPPPGDPPFYGLSLDQRFPISKWPSGFGNILNLYCWSLEVKEDYLYLGTFDASSLLIYLTVLLSQEQIDQILLDINNMKCQLTTDDIVLIQEFIDGQEVQGCYKQELIDLIRSIWIDEGEITLEMLIALYTSLAGADLWKTNDGIHWCPVTLNGFDNNFNYGFRNMKFVDLNLYVGAANPFQGCEILKASQCPVCPDSYCADPGTTGLSLFGTVRCEGVNVIVGETELPDIWRGAAGTQPADWIDATAAAGLWFLCVDSVLYWDHDSYAVDQATGRTELPGHEIMSGGPLVNAPVKYYEGAKLAPVYYKASGGYANFFDSTTDTQISGAQLLGSEIGPSKDMFVIMILQKPGTELDPEYAIMAYGFAGRGTLAATVYFKMVIEPDLSSYTRNYYIVQWDDTNGNGHPDIPGTDTYTPITPTP